MPKKTSEEDTKVRTDIFRVSELVENANNICDSSVDIRALAAGAMTHCGVIDFDMEEMTISDFKKKVDKFRSMEVR